MSTAVQKMAEAHMQHLGVYPPLKDFEGEEYHDYHWHEEEGEEEEGEEEEKSPSQGAGERAAPTTGPCVLTTATRHRQEGH